MSAALQHILRTPPVRRYDPGMLAAFLTRASAAWGFDPATGLLTQYASNVARLVLSPVGVMSVLREPQSTNRITQSDDVNTWTKSSCTASATRLTASAGAGFHYATTAVTATNGAASTFSVDVKYVNNAWLFFCQPNDSTLTYFNVQAGTFGTIGAGVTASVGALQADGYYRVELRGTSAAANAPGVGLANADGGGSFTAAGTEAVDIRRAQEEAQSGATSIIPTAGSTVTRSRDEIVIPTVVGAGAPFSEVIDFCLPWAGASARLTSDGAANKDMYTGASFTLGTYNGSDTVDVVNTYAANARARAAQCANNAGRAVCLNGGAVATGSTTFGAISARYLGAESSGANGLVLYIHEYRQARRRLSHGELQWHTTA